MVKFKGTAGAQCHRAHSLFWSISRIAIDSGLVQVHNVNQLKTVSSALNTKKQGLVSWAHVAVILNVSLGIEVAYRGQLYTGRQQR